jgi:DNA-binding response OmpR family regulator
MTDEVDAVLLDRRMPDLHGDDVLEELRGQGYDCPVIMITAVDPDLNILDMDFDDYLTKPVERETLLSTLDQHLTSRTGDPRLEELFATLSKVDVLEAEHPPAQRAESDEYGARLERVEGLRGELAAADEDCSESIETFREINRP